jgi:hypothetical protein
MDPLTKKATTDIKKCAQRRRNHCRVEKRSSLIFAGKSFNKEIIRQNY